MGLDRNSALVTSKPLHKLTPWGLVAEDTTAICSEGCFSGFKLSFVNTGYPEPWVNFTPVSGEISGHTHAPPITN